MTSKVRTGFVIALVLLMFACREDKYELRTSVRTAGDGRSYLTIEVFRGKERVCSHSEIEMAPGAGAGSEGRQDHGPTVLTQASFDREGRGALVTLQVKKDAKVLAQTARFVARPAPAGYVRAGIGNGVMPPLAIDHSNPLYPERARRDRREGVVYVDARINTLGTVDSVALLNPAPNWDGLDQAAAEAVRVWRFTPATRHGKRVAVAAVQRIDFELPRTAQTALGIP